MKVTFSPCFISTPSYGTRLTRVVIASILRNFGVSFWKWRFSAMNLTLSSNSLWTTPRMERLYSTMSMTISSVVSSATIDAERTSSATSAASPNDWPGPETASKFDHSSLWACRTATTLGHLLTTTWNRAEGRAPYTLDVDSRRSSSTIYFFTQIDANDAALYNDTGTTDFLFDPETPDLTRQKLDSPDTRHAIVYWCQSSVGRQVQTRDELLILSLSDKILKPNPNLVWTWPDSTKKPPDQTRTLTGVMCKTLIWCDACDVFFK